MGACALKRRAWRSRSDCSRRRGLDFGAVTSELSGMVLLGIYPELLARPRSFAGWCFWACIESFLREGTSCPPGTLAERASEPE
mmetsp:Transcript_65377/g.181834  ORF Transcript_65377/g.181834 Transcript_65377/m.181834 type:complete len:84 (+) Transcript_65377:67-318(+)